MSAPSNRPPPIARWLLLLVAPSQERDAIDGDLQERFRYDIHLAGASSSRAARDYTREVVRSAWPLLTSRADPARLARFALIVVLAVWLTSCVSYLLGSVASRALPTVTLEVRVLLQIAVVIPFTALTGFLARRLSKIDSLAAPVVVAVGLITPALLASWHPNFIVARVAWVLLIPVFTVLGGAMGNQPIWSSRG